MQPDGGTPNGQLQGQVPVQPADGSRPTAVPLPTPQPVAPPQFQAQQPAQPFVAQSPEPTAQAASAGPIPVGNALSWQSSEYIHHEKQRLWFVGLFAGGLVLLAVALFLIQSITFAILVVVMTIVLAVFAVRPPRIVDYELSPGGVKINQKMFAYHDFRSFGIIQDGPLYSAILIPNKRFMPAVNIYFPTEDGEEIVDMLGSYLPMEEVHLDSLDKIARQLRF